MSKRICGIYHPSADTSSQIHRGLYCEEPKGHGRIQASKTKFDHHGQGVWWNDERNPVSDKKNKKKPKLKVLEISDNDLMQIALQLLSIQEMLKVTKESSVYSVSYLHRDLKVEIYDTDGGPGDLDLEVRITSNAEADIGNINLPGYEEHQERVAALKKDKPKRWNEQ